MVGKNETRGLSWNLSPPRSRRCDPLMPTADRQSVNSAQDPSETRQ